MHKDIKYTIAIPAFKGRFLKEAVESCLNQSTASMEVIVLDDASPDDISGICASFTDSRLKYFRNDINVGAERVVDNWNKCLELASGDYFICIGDDDRLTPNALATYSALIGRYPGLDVYHGQAEVIDENGSLKKTLLSRPEYESVYSLIWNRWNGRNQQYVGDFCYRTDALRRMGGYEFLPLAWGSDDITAVEAASKTGIANTSEVCFQYRDNGLSISNSLNQTIKMDAVCLEEKWYLSFLENEPDNEDDKVLWGKLVEQLPDFYHRKKVYTMLCDLFSDKLSIFKWIRCHRDYQISCYDIFVAFLKALYRSL